MYPETFGSERVICLVAWEKSCVSAQDTGRSTEAASSPHFHVETVCGLAFFSPLDMANPLV
ncbi:MAG: hypothetical protein A2516_11635 [Alphaproteobacteria bacterium RIFOXYD12_FULL_60_8]|nr:MAG: hypothetical protein A2516_11635 [Alphaproteobacteria bacterium RIFOXYD12_FULL_60_8]